MQAVRNHIQVYARCDRSPPAPAHVSSIPQRTAVMADLMSPPSGLYGCVMILITICSRRPAVLLGPLEQGLRWWKSCQHANVLYVHVAAS